MFIRWWGKFRLPCSCNVIKYSRNPLNIAAHIFHPHNPANIQAPLFELFILIYFIDWPAKANSLKGRKKRKRKWKCGRRRELENASKSGGFPYISAGQNAPQPPTAFYYACPTPLLYFSINTGTMIPWFSKASISCDHREIPPQHGHMTAWKHHLLLKLASQ